MPREQKVGRQKGVEGGRGVEEEKKKMYDYQLYWSWPKQNIRVKYRITVDIPPPFPPL